MAWWCRPVGSWTTTVAPCLPLLPSPLPLLVPTKAHQPRRSTAACLWQAQVGFSNLFQSLVGCGYLLPGRRGINVNFDWLSGFPTDQRNGDKEFVIRRAATNRVLNVLRHWVSKHSQVRWSKYYTLLKIKGFCSNTIEDQFLDSQRTFHWSVLKRSFFFLV